MAGTMEQAAVGVGRDFELLHHGWRDRLRQRCPEGGRIECRLSGRRSEEADRLWAGLKEQARGRRGQRRPWFRVDEAKRHNEHKCGDVEEETQAVGVVHGRSPGAQASAFLESCCPLRFLQIFSTGEYHTGCRGQGGRAVGTRVLSGGAPRGYWREVHPKGITPQGGAL
jgi:hypothetical protein